VHRHSRGDELPGKEVEPSAHARHPTAPMFMEYVPGAHGAHTPPSESANVPGAHGMHSTAAREVFPATHGMHATTPCDIEIFPASHCAHSAPDPSPVTFEYFPTPQSSQLTLLSAEYVPTPHSTHED